MPFSPSPLRYPGGKTQLYSFVRTILYANALNGGTYVEPFAGGAGLAIKLLLNGDVDKILINDFDLAIYAIWSNIVNHPDEFCSFVSNCKIDINEWHKHKERLVNYSNLFELGTSAFFLNRTNVSGVIKGGVIGGKAQSGRYKIDARFNRDGLIKRIIKIAEHKDRIVVTNKDAIFFISELQFEDEKVFINFDPPYVKKGGQLYKNSYTESEHIELSKKIIKVPYHWIVTYDICDLVKKLYCSQRCSKLSVNYSIGEVKAAKEYIFFCDNLKIPCNLPSGKDV